MYAFYCWIVYVLLPGQARAGRVPVEALAQQTIEQPWFVIMGVSSKGEILPADSVVWLPTDESYCIRNKGRKVPLRLSSGWVVI